MNPTMSLDSEDGFGIMSPSSPVPRDNDEPGTQPRTLGDAPRTAQKKMIDDEEGDERRISQRQKQLNFGFVTKGYANMMKLCEADPRLVNGKILPLVPPAANMKASKRHWDALIRKWRRALHMFDHVYIDGADNEGRSLEDVVELQRQAWVNTPFASCPKDIRAKFTVPQLLAMQDCCANIPKKLQVEESLAPLLRSVEMYEPILETPEPGARVTAVRNTSPLSATKMLIGPGGASSAYSVVPRLNRSPSPENLREVAPNFASMSPQNAQTPQRQLWPEPMSKFATPSQSKPWGVNSPKGGSRRFELKP